MTRTLARFTLLVLALTLSISAFAGSKSETITLYHDAQLNGKTLRAGEYTIKCNNTGATSQVTFLRNGREVATATGQMKQLSNAPESNQIVTQDGNGSASISEIDFAHSNNAVTFESASMSAGGN